MVSLSKIAAGHTPPPGLIEAPPLFLVLQQPSVQYVLRRGRWMRHLEEHTREGGHWSVHGRGLTICATLLFGGRWGVTINNIYFVGVSASFVPSCSAS